MTACGAVVGGVSLDGVDVSKQAVIQGEVTVGDLETPASVGYVRLLDAQGEFVAEVPISPEGQFRFFATTGIWTVVALIPGGSARLEVNGKVGQILDLVIQI